MTLSAKSVRRCRIWNEGTRPIGTGRVTRPMRRVRTPTHLPSTGRSGAGAPSRKRKSCARAFWPGNRVSDVAQCYGLNRKQLSAWRTLARKGKLVLPSSIGPEAEPAFAAIEVDPAPEPDRGSVGSISIGAREHRVTVRLDGEIGAGRIAEIASVLRSLR